MRKKLKPLSVIGISICFISCMYFILLIWSNMTRYIFDVRIIILLISLSISSAHICMLLSLKSNNQLVTTFRFYTIALSIIMNLLYVFSSYSKLLNKDFIIIYLYSTFPNILLYLILYCSIYIWRYVEFSHLWNFCCNNL